MPTFHEIARGNYAEQLDPAEVAALSDAELSEAYMRGVATLLTRGRPALGQCPAKRIVDEAWNEGQTADELNRITDLVQHGAECGRWDDIEIGRIVRRMVVRYALGCVDKDKAEAEYREAMGEDA